MRRTYQQMMEQATALPERYDKHWTREEDNYLTFNWGVENLLKICEHLDRTPWGVSNRARKLKLGPAHRGTYAIADVARILKSGHETIVSIMDELRMSRTRSRTGDPRAKSKYNRLALDHDDLERIEERLEQRRARGWGVHGKPPACKGCGTTDRPHDCNGLCRRCYMRRRDANERTDNGGRKRAYGHDPVLTPEKVIEMRNKRQAGASYRALGREFGVSRRAATMVCKGESWKHVGGPIE